MWLLLVALAGHDEWAVIRAAERLATTLPWHTSVPLPNEDVVARLQDYPRSTAPAVVAGVPTPDSAEATAARADEYDPDITITRPYQMHGSISAASGNVECWRRRHLQRGDHQPHTRRIPFTSSHCRSTGAGNQHVPHVTHAPGSGCYGHNGADDAAFDAALIARAIPEQRVVEVTRANEHCFEPYASAMAVARANLTDNGAVALWEHDSYSDTHARPRPGLGVSLALPERTYLAAPALAFVAEPNLGRHAGIHRNADPTYTFGDVRREAICFTVCRVYLRCALGAFCNVLAIESAMDELAHLADADPLDFRARHLMM